MQLGGGAGVMWPCGRGLAEDQCLPQSQACEAQARDSRTARGRTHSSVSLHLRSPCSRGLLGLRSERGSRGFERGSGTAALLSLGLREGRLAETGPKIPERAGC